MQYLRIQETHNEKRLICTSLTLEYLGIPWTAALSTFEDLTQGESVNGEGAEGEALAMLGERVRSLVHLSALSGEEPKEEDEEPVTDSMSSAW